MGFYGENKSKFCPAAQPCPNEKFLSVPGRGLEPPHLAVPAPKAGVYTNFTTPA